MGMETYRGINQGSHSRVEMPGTSNTWHHHNHTPDSSQKIESKRRVQINAIEAERPDRKPIGGLPKPDTGVDPAIDAIVSADGRDSTANLSKTAKAVEVQVISVTRCPARRRDSVIPLSERQRRTSEKGGGLR